MNKRWKALTVPYETIESDETDAQCYRLSGKTVKMLLAMIQYMEWPTRWYRADNLPLTVNQADNVKAWAAQAAYELMTPEPCADEGCEEGNCVAYFPTNPAFTYAPNNPYTQCENPPTGYLTCPLVSGVQSGIPGALPDDVYCSIPTLLPAPPLGLIDQVLNSGFPRVHMEFVGSGELEVHLLEVAQGGLAIIRIDDVAYVNVVNLQGISLSDIAVSLDFVVTVVTGLLDWQFVGEKIVEFSVPDGNHTLDILFIPNVSLNVLESGWGGGLRKVVLCGDFTVTACPDTLIDPIYGGGEMSLFRICKFLDENGEIQHKISLNGGCTWDVVDWCSDSPVIPPTEPISEIDEPGTYPDPPLSGDRCRVIQGTFNRVWVQSTAFSSSVLNASALGRMSALVVFLDSLDETGNGLQWYDVFSAFVTKYVPFAGQISTAMESPNWEDYIACIVDSCYPGLLPVTREITDCIHDSLKALADEQVSGSDLEALINYYADWYKIYPLSVLRADAFRDSVNPEVTDPCPTCDAPEPTSCGPILVTFDAGSDPYTVLVGGVNTAYEGQGVWSVDVGLSGGNEDFLPPPSGQSYAKYNKLKVSIPVPDCVVKNVYFRVNYHVSNPSMDSRLKAAVQIRMTFKLNGAEVGYYKSEPLYEYAALNQGWLRIPCNPTDVLCDEIVFVIGQGTTYASRLLSWRVDSIEIVTE